VSQRNVATVRGLNEALNRGDLAAVLGYLDADVRWWDRVDDPGATVHHGHAGIRQLMVDGAEHFAELRLQAEDFIELGDCVVMPVLLFGRGRSSGATFEEREVHLFRLRGGKVVEVREYHDETEALRAAADLSPID
jgi:hypothetical protein